MIIIKVETVVQYFSGFFDERKVQHLCEMEIFCNTVNVFTVSVDQFNVYLQNRSINLKKNEW